MNLQQATQLISAIGHSNTVLLRGAPGVGKSSILKALAATHPEYHVAYVDVANLDLGDLGMPVIDREQMTTSYAPSTRFGLGANQKRPVLLMLDELGKASRPVLNMLLPVILERRLGDVTLPEGSIVFGTTNLDTDGVGDNIPAHAYNRMTVVRVDNPTVDEWLLWAANADIDPVVREFARRYPQAFECYDSGDQDDNPYIFNPRTGRTKAFCSPRSLAAASNLIKAREAIGSGLLQALIGTIGESAARDMDALVHLIDQVPPYEQVIAKPDTTKLPTDAGGQFLMAFMLSGRVKEDTLDAVLTYMGRMKDTAFEAYTLFIHELARNPKKVGFACRNRACTHAMSLLGRYF